MKRLITSSNKQSLKCCGLKSGGILFVNVFHLEATVTVLSALPTLYLAHA